MNKIHLTKAFLLIYASAFAQIELPTSKLDTESKFYKEYLKKKTKHRELDNKQSIGRDKYDDIEFEIGLEEGEKTVILVVNGQGKTPDEAKQNALKCAIEQAFGAFISSKTEILNDKLIKDEIVSVANGNIQRFDVINETLLPNNVYLSTLNATVSLSNLKSFCKSKGITSEFKGELFATNILIQEFYENNELIALNNIIEILSNIAKNSFDYNILTKDPISNNGNWHIPVQLNVLANKNFLQIPSFLLKSIKSISLSVDEVGNYIRLNKPIFPITIATSDNRGIYYLRNQNSIHLIIDFIYSISKSIVNFKIDNGVEKFELEKYNISNGSYGYENTNLELDDRNFRIILKKGYGNDCEVCAASLFNNYCGSVYQSKKPEFDYKKVYTKGYFGERYDYIKGYSIDYLSIKKKPMQISTCDIWSEENFKSFIPLKKIMLSNPVSGLVISFAKIREGSSLMNFYFNDVRNIEEIKKISKYEIIKKD